MPGGKQGLEGETKDSHIDTALSVATLSASATGQYIAAAIREELRSSQTTHLADPEEMAVVPCPPMNAVESPTVYRMQHWRFINQLRR